MCRVRSCCFCCSLRTGTYIAAIYTLFATVFVFITTIVALVKVSTSGDNFNDALGTGQVGDAVQGDKSDDSVLGKIVYYATAILYIVWFISAILVIVGCMKERRGFLLPWLVCTIIIVVFMAIAVIMSCFDIKAVFEDASRGLAFAIQCAIFAVSVYMVIVVCSFYRNHCKEADER